MYIVYSHQNDTIQTNTWIFSDIQIFVTSTKPKPHIIINHNWPLERQPECASWTNAADAAIDKSDIYKYINVQKFAQMYKYLQMSKFLAGQRDYVGISPPVGLPVCKQIWFSTVHKRTAVNSPVWSGINKYSPTLLSNIHKRKLQLNCS